MSSPALSMDTGLPACAPGKASDNQQPPLQPARALRSGGVKARSAHAPHAAGAASKEAWRCRCSRNAQAGVASWHASSRYQGLCRVMRPPDATPGAAQMSNCLPAGAAGVAAAASAAAAVAAAIVAAAALAAAAPLPAAPASPACCRLAAACRLAAPCRLAAAAAAARPPARVFRDAVRNDPCVLRCSPQRQP